MKTIVIALFATLLVNSAWAVEIETSPVSYITTVPAPCTQYPNGIPLWTSGWGRTDITGWDYVGQISTNGGSAVYLGNGWVLTAGHIGYGNFLLGGDTYNGIYGSETFITNSEGRADLDLFQIDVTSIHGNVLNLPPLVIGTANPVAFAYNVTGSMVAIIGFGGGNRSWGYNTVTAINYGPVNITPPGFISNDFQTITGTTTVYNSNHSRSQSVTNQAQLIIGDSGGPAFIYNSATSQWNLAGINEAANEAGSSPAFSVFVQLSTYAALINEVLDAPTDTPTMPVIALFIMAGFLCLAATFTLVPRSSSR